VFSGTAPDLTAPAGSWYFPAGAAATPEQVAAVAKALGVEGDVRTLPAEVPPPSDANVRATGS
jgi:hypothetical protein